MDRAGQGPQHPARRVTRNTQVGADAAAQFTRRLSLIRHAPSLGGVDSLVSEPRVTSHEHLTPDERLAQGIPDGFLRLSCGCEDPEDLLDDLAGALQ